jgi:hypothetical protein
MLGHQGEMDAMAMGKRREPWGIVEKYEKIWEHIGKYGKISENMGKYTINGGIIPFKTII